MMVCMKTGRPAKKPRTDFGKRLALIREEKGISQSELAQAMGVTQCAVAHWERRSIRLTPEEIVKLTQVLDVTYDQLFGAVKPSSRTRRSGKMRRLFEVASKLPRRQQDKIVEFIEPYIERHQVQS